MLKIMNTFQQGYKMYSSIKIPVANKSKQGGKAGFIESHIESQAGVEVPEHFN